MQQSEGGKSFLDEPSLTFVETRLEAIASISDRFDFGQVPQEDLVPGREGKYVSRVLKCPVTSVTKPLKDENTFLSLFD